MPRSRSECQLNLPPSLLTNGSQEAALRTKRSQGADPLTGRSHEADRRAAALLDAAFQDARLTNAEIAYLCGIGESLVRRWRSPEYREQPSLGQLLRLPVAFHLALHKALDAAFGFSRAAVAEAIAAIGRLAVAVTR